MPLPTAGQGIATFPVTIGQGGTGQTTAALARQALGLQIGTDVLAPNGDGSALTGIPTLAGVNPFTNTTASTSSTTGAATFAGGIGVVKDSWINTVRIGLGAGGDGTSTVVGAAALNAVTSGSGLTAMGWQALNANTTGTLNTAFGTRALEVVVSGASNSAFGWRAGGSLTGSRNTAIGMQAFLNATTATDSVALGNDAGRWQLNGSTVLALTGAGNIFIGKDTRGSANAQTNSITLGYQALSEGSNTNVIGNLSTAFTNIWGLGVSRGLLWGCTLSNNVADATNDIDITLGECRDSTGIRSINCAAMTKQLNANWAVGTAQGFRNSAIAIADTTYHIYAVATADGTQDYYAHTSTTVATVIAALQAESGGALYLYARRIGSIVRAGGIILLFTQDGDDFSRTTPVLDVDDATLTTSRKTYTLASVPAGLRLKVRVRMTFSHVTAGTIAIFGDLNETDAAPSGTASPLASMYVHNSLQSNFRELDIFTNTSAQIFGRASAAASTTTCKIAPLMWTDTRGRVN